MGFPYDLGQTVWHGREAPYIPASESSYSVNFTISGNDYTSIGITNIGQSYGYCLVVTPENSSTPEILYSSGTQSWSSGAPDVSFVDGDDIASSDLLNLVNTCFWVDDMSGSCWRWADSCTFQDYLSGNFEFALLDDRTVTFWAMEADEGYLYYTDPNYNQVIAYDDSSGWMSDDYKTFIVLDAWGYDEDIQNTLRQDTSMFFLIPPDVTISYKGAEIATMSESGTKTLQTQGKYCEGDIVVSYTKSGGGGGGGQLYIFSDSTYLHEEAYLGNQAMSSRAAFTDPNLAAGVTVTFYTWGDYILDTIEGITSGNTYPFTTVTRGTYTFTMPNESVDCLLVYDD